MDGADHAAPVFAFFAGGGGSLSCSASPTSATCSRATGWVAFFPSILAFHWALNLSLAPRSTLTMLWCVHPLDLLWGFLHCSLSSSGSAHTMSSRKGWWSVLVGIFALCARRVRMSRPVRRSRGGSLGPKFSQHTDSRVAFLNAMRCSDASLASLPAVSLIHSLTMCQGMMALRSSWMLKPSAQVVRHSWASSST